MDIFKETFGKKIKDISDWKSEHLQLLVAYFSISMVFIDAHCHCSFWRVCGVNLFLNLTKLYINCMIANLTTG